MTWVESTDGACECTVRLHLYLKPLRVVSSGHRRVGLPGEEVQEEVRKMSTIASRSEQVMLTDQERAYAARFLEVVGGDATEFVTSAGEQVPKPLNEIIRTVLNAIAEGRPVAVSAMPDLLTTTNAASLLGVSRPTLMKWVRNGRIAAEKVGSHNRLRAGDVLVLREQLKEEQRSAVFDLLDMDEVGSAD